MLSSQIENRMSLFLSLFIFLFSSFQKSRKPWNFSLPWLVISKEWIRKCLIIIKLSITKIESLAIFRTTFNNLFFFLRFYPIKFLLLLKIIFCIIAKRQKLIRKNRRNIYVSFVKWFLWFLFRFFCRLRFNLLYIREWLHLFLIRLFRLIFPNKLE